MASERQPLPERPRRYRFALTPLADAMFQLLIFFMLSTSLTPYSLLTLKHTPAEVDAEAAAQTGGGAEETSSAQTIDAAIWTVSRGQVQVAAGQVFEIDQVGDLAEAFSNQDNPASVVLIVEPNAQIQDVARVLEALENANVGAVQISKGEA